MACTFAVKPELLQAGMDSDQLLALASPDWEDFYHASSRSGWYQGLLSRTLAAYPEFAALEFATHDLVAIPAQQAGKAAALLRQLLERISCDPRPFSRLDYTEENCDEIRRQVAEAQVLRQMDDDSVLAHGNFFSHLLTQAVAWEAAAQANLAIVRVQLGPSPIEERLTWPPA